LLFVVFHHTASSMPISILIAELAISFTSAEPMGDDGVFIMGFDILPFQSPRSKTNPRFSCIIMRDGAVLNEYPDLSKGNLLNLVREIRPIYLATDNVFEMAPDSKSLFELSSKIPPETKMVQVTGAPPDQIPLRVLARRYGVQSKGKLTPLESARVAAYLVSIGVGHSLECFGEQTEIKVTRGRKMGRGGQSVNRYRRKIHSEIQQATRFIESQLKAAGIEYDIDVRGSDFGYASSRFVAYAPLPAIRGLVESKRGGDFNVLVSPVRKRVEFLPLEPKPVRSEFTPQYFILGIDPGTTAALCLMSLDGAVAFLTSKKGLTRADMIRMVYEHGVPVLVATDVTPVPHLVKKIASTINVEVFTPSRPIAVADKQELARQFSQEVQIGNAHERDAMTAAVYAYRSILPKLEEIDCKLRKEQIAVDRNHLKALVVKGMSVNQALMSLTREEPEVVEITSEPQVPEEELTQARFNALKEKNEALESESRALLERNEDLKRLVEFLRFRESEIAHSLEIVSRENYWRVKCDREVVKRESELGCTRHEVDLLCKQVQDLTKRLELLRGVRRLELKGDMLAVKIIPHFTRESIVECFQRVSIKPGDIVLFEDASGGGPQTARMLIDWGVKAAIVDTPLSHLSEEALTKAAIPVIDAKLVELQRVDEFAFISRKKLENQLQDFMKEVREKARREGEDQLVEMVERYKREVER